jgi:hypothetical protein
MEREGLDDEAMGKKLKEPKSRVTISRYRRGVETPPSETVREFVEMSKGAMTANDLLGIKVKARAVA